MGHIGGIRDVFDLALQFCGAGRAVRSDALVECYRDVSDVNFPAGTAWSYSNGGYVLLTAAIERIAGAALEEVLDQLVFRPIGMSRTMLRRWDTDFVSNSASLHSIGQDGSYEKAYLGMALGGEGGLVSTVDDMLIWLSHMEEPKVGSTETWSTLKSPLRLMNGNQTCYGLGLMKTNYRGVEVLSHAGGVLGGNAQMLRVPCAKLDVVVMVNRDNLSAAKIANDILDSCLPDLGPNDEPKVELAAMGAYRSDSTGRTVQLFGQDQKQIAAIDGLDIPLVRIDKRRNIFRPVDTLNHLQYTLELGGMDRAKPDSVRMTDCGTEDVLDRLELGDRAASNEIEGHYCSPSTGVELTICPSAEGMLLEGAWRFGSSRMKLEAVGACTWRVRPRSGLPWGGIVSCGPSDGALHFWSDRTKALKFARRH